MYRQEWVFGYNGFRGWHNEGDGGADRTQAAVFEAKEKLYAFEQLCAGSTLFRCSKSMILNAEKIDYVCPSLSGRFEAVLSNGEKAVVSRKYVADLKRMLGV